MRGSWESRVVQALIAFKRRGVEFNTAWQDVTRRFPPRSRDDFSATLFEADETERPVTQAAFFREACRAAWFGEQPALRYFSLVGLMPDEDTSMPANRKHAA